MQIQDEVILNGNFFSKAMMKLIVGFIHTIFNYCINMDYKSLLTQK